MEYITTNHDAYILTNLTVNDFDRVTARATLYDYACETSTPLGFPNLFGSRTDISGYQDGKLFRFYDNNIYNSKQIKTFASFYDDFWSEGWPVYSPTTVSLNEAVDYDIKLANGEQYIKINGTTVASNTLSAGVLNNSYPVVIFGTNYGGVVKDIPHLDCEYITFYKDGNIVANFIPAKRNSDNVLGMYDTVNNVFYTNSGTGSFIAGPVVETYTELEYIDIPANTGFNTNVYLNGNMDIEYEVMITQISSLGQFGGARSEAVGGAGFNFPYNYNHPTNGTNILVDFFGSQNSNGRWTIQRNGSTYVPEANKKYKLSIINKVGTFSVDGTVIDTHTYVADGIPNTVPYGIHATYNVDTFYYEYEDTMRFYHFSATGVADIVPAQRDSDGELGLYNKITGEFLEKIGSGTLVAGPAVDNPGVSEPSCEYTRLEYLKSSDAQYIQDNSFQPISTGAIEIKTKDLQTYTRFAGWDGLVALATPNSVTNYFPFLYGSWDDYNPNPVSIAAENALRYEFEPGLQKLYVNGVLNRQAQKNTWIYSAPFRMFIVSTGGGYNHGSTIYYCRVYDGNNVLLRNYIPVKRNSDNVLGMYDTVTKTFFTNAGTGTFIAGPELAWGNNCSVTISITWGGLAEPDASGMCTYGETFTAPSTAPTAPSGLKFLGWRPIGQ